MIRHLTEHPTAANLLMVALLLLGLSALPDMKRETFPAIETDKVTVSVVYRGATSEEVEDAVCRRLEDAIEGVNDLIEVRCEAVEGRATATAVKREQASMTRFLDDIKSQVDAISDLPADTDLPVVTEAGRIERVISVAITGFDDPRQLRDYANRLESRLSALADVDNVTMRGFSDRQLQISIPAWRLREFGLSITDIANAIQRHSISMPAGTLQGSAEDAIVRFDTRAKSIEALSIIPIVTNTNGAEIKLGDIARIDDQFELAEEKVLFDGQRAALLDISKTSARDSLVVLEQVRTLVGQEQGELPPGIALTLTQDAASVIGQRLNLLVRNGLQGLALVFAILWLFFNMRYGFWVAMGLPVSFLGGLFVLSLMQVSLNMISMVGLLIGIGLLMDDAIVIAENVARRLHAGDSPLVAAARGAREVLPGVMSSFGTTILIFGALAFLSGTMGQVLRVLPVVLIVVLAVSLLEAFFILPNHLAHALRAEQDGVPPSRFRQRFERGFNYVRDQVVERVIARAVEHRFATLGLVLMAVLMSVAVIAGGRIGFVGFPNVDGDIVEARILLPQGTPLARTEAVVEQLDRALTRINQEFTKTQPSAQSLVRHRTVIFGENPDAYETGPHVARIAVDLLGAEIRTTRVDDFVKAWREATGDIADVITIKYSQPAIGPAGRAIDIRLHGEDLDRLNMASAQLRRWISGFEGVVDLGDDLRPGKREYKVQIRPGADGLGLDAKTISDQLRASFQGVIVDEFPVGPETYEVQIQVAASDRAGPANLHELMLTSPDGRAVPLRSVATVTETRGWARIHRVDGQRTVTIQGDVDTALTNAQALVGITANTYMPELRQRFPDVLFSLEGENKNSAQTNQSLLRNALLGLVGVYLILAFQFRSYVLPLGVMLVIPTALIGVVAGHLIVGIDISLPSLVGMTSLAGIVVNNAILLVQFIEQARVDGQSIDEAAVHAAGQRFRPILLSTLTTVAGLLPLLSETSRQAQTLIPLAVSLAFGLVAATVFALLLVPAFYCAVAEFVAKREDPAASFSAAPSAP